ncbi:MAG: hypothetical protein IT531_21565 [Burkholderiales bacterium]|nr:hypothetical protein [Burkholderiales bacterium]
MRVHRSIGFTALSLLLTTLPAVAAANTSASTAQAAPVKPAEGRVGSVARLLAGLPPSLPAHVDLAESSEWREHRDIVQAGWAKVKQGRGDVMARWRDQTIRTPCSGSGTLLYPFSGPDFANAYVLFPGCKNYVLFGLELPGEVPELEKLDRQALARLLSDVRVAVGDLVERNYFITSRMSRQLHTSQLRGVVPVLIASMALAGLEVRSLERLELPAAARSEEEAEPADAKPLRKLRAVQITFQQPGSAKTQTLQYFSVDATNRGLAPYPEFLAHLRSAKPAPMLIKSASYLLQDKQFRAIRNTLLESAEFLVQDDTGMPYEVLKASGWDMQLYGGYRKPIPPFHWAYQAKLDAAYKSANAATLPFSFSYHWNGGKSNAMVARRVAMQAAAPESGEAAPAR